jgi:hypothetical protein
MKIAIWTHSWDLLMHWSRGGGEGSVVSDILTRGLNPHRLNFCFLLFFSLPFFSFVYIQMFFYAIIKGFITLLVHVNKSRTRAPFVTLTFSLFTLVWPCWCYVWGVRERERYMIASSAVVLFFPNKVYDCSLRHYMYFLMFWWSVHLHWGSGRLGSCLARKRV